MVAAASQSNITKEDFVKATAEKKLRKKLATHRLNPQSIDASVLDPIPFVYAGRQLNIDISSDEFTHICPMTGLPDFGQLNIQYQPDKKIIELKSLKYYLVQYRQVGIFYEHVIFKILDDLVAAIKPLRMSIRYNVKSRGGISALVTASWP